MFALHLSGAIRASFARHFHNSLQLNAAARCVTTELRGDVAVVRIDIPGSKVNVLNEQVVKEFDEAFAEVQANDKVKSVVLISGKTTSFIAGADIK